MDNDSARPLTSLPAAGPGSRRRGLRRQMIMDQAAILFFERGFHATGIDDIGEAAGVSGPAIYRHFRSKDELLVAIIEATIDRTISKTEAARLDRGDAKAQLKRHVQTQARLSMEAPHLGALMAKELATLPPVDRSRIVRKVRLNREEWVHLMSEARPDLTDGEVRVRLDGVIGLVRDLSTGRAAATMGIEERIELTARMVLAAIYA